MTDESATGTAEAIDDSEIASDLDHLPSTGLLSFYDRLRERIREFAANRGNTVSQTTLEALLLIPDVFMLLVRLAIDPDVPKSTRALIGGALAYFILPVDLLPEAFVGAVGYSDDLVFALTVVASAFSRDLEPVAAKYWSGSQSLRSVVGDILQASQALLGTKLDERLRSLLTKRGIDFDAHAASES